VISGIARVQALRHALQSSETALQATESGYDAGSRTAVDLLNARRNLVQAQTDYSSSRYDFIVSIIRLRYAAGNLDQQQLQQINGWLTATAATSPVLETPESLMPALSPDTIEAPIMLETVLPPPGRPQPAGREPHDPLP
jgi:hypothetical protein